MPIEVRVGRVHEGRTPRDGTRILVDRSWPGGMREVDADIDGWIKGAAPSNGLCGWFAHDLARFEEFRRRYLVELQSAGPRAALDDLIDSAPRGRITLLTDAQDVEHSHTAVLAEVLRRLFNTHPRSDFAQIARWEGEGGWLETSPDDPDESPQGP